jgi:hypothetical protein
MMIMGFISFGVFIAVNSIPAEDIDSGWLISFEFVHIVVLM